MIWVNQSMTCLRSKKRWSLDACLISACRSPSWRGKSMFGREETMAMKMGARLAESDNYAEACIVCELGAVLHNVWVREAC